MKKHLLALPASFFLLIGMVGCATSDDGSGRQSDAAQSMGADTEAQSEAAQSASDVEQADLPIELDKEQAGMLFLDVVCGVNEVSLELNEVVATLDEEYMNGGDPDPSEYTQLAATYADKLLLGVRVFDDEHYIWPPEVRELIPDMRDTFMANVTLFRAVAQASTWNDVLNMSGEAPESPSQEIRYQLDIESDPHTSCEGHYGKLEDLAKESKARKD